MSELQDVVVGTSPSRPRAVIAKTSLDGHWRGVTVVGRALRDAGFEVVLIGMAGPDAIVSSVIDEDADLLGLNVGGRVEVAERTIDAVRNHRPDIPVIAGGTIAPWAKRRLEELGVSVFPPGSSLDDIATTARHLCGLP